MRLLFLQLWKKKTVKVITKNIGKIFVYNFEKFKLKFSVINIDSVTADGPITNGIAIRKNYKNNWIYSLIFLLTNLPFRSFFK